MIHTPLYQLDKNHLDQRFIKAFAFLSDPELANYEDGTYPIDGTNAYAMIQSFDVPDTNPIDVEFETHREYIDIQYVITGTLEIGITHSDNLTPNTEYNPKDDVIFYERYAPYTLIKLAPGEFAVLYPEDAHRMICIPAEGTHTHIRKCVVKVHV